MSNAQLEGSFVGIGIEYNIFKDTLNVITAISGGPAEKAGLISGDKIVEVSGSSIAGQKLEQRSITDKLRGEEGSTVEVGVLRGGRSELLKFKITRSKITTSTVEIAYMLDKETAYIKITRFGAKTYDEFAAGLDSLKKKGATKLVIDLRDNGGGYLDRAIDMADTFLPKGDMIVYTKGREGAFDEQYLAKENGKFEEGAVIVLINESSASASEVLSGALQDQDRALIVGRRSFGKGLVQRPFRLNDGAGLRLTISRYYTPSGRSIQKHYVHSQYDEKLDDRFAGELFSADSIKRGTEYATLRLKRKVYGGGGIHPDVFVPLDTAYRSPYYLALADKNLMREFALLYSTRSREDLKNMGLQGFLENFSGESVMSEFLEFATKSGVAFNAQGYERCRNRLPIEIKAHIARNMWQEEGFYPVFRALDNELAEAMRQWEEAAKLKGQ
jgi:carboxyl-terminal processing protease